MHALETEFLTDSSATWTRDLNQCLSLEAWAAPLATGFVRIVYNINDIIWAPCLLNPEQIEEWLVQIKNSQGQEPLPLENEIMPGCSLHPKLNVHCDFNGNLDASGFDNTVLSNSFETRAFDERAYCNAF